ncbi:hypothetical protein ACQV2C_04100 [Pantoea allii]|uniref:hypothetical protein n=1 Tax=Pantoea allii TaxID=574096 RepID=UPI003D31FFF6
MKNNNKKLITAQQCDIFVIKLEAKKAHSRQAALGKKNLATRCFSLLFSLSRLA